MAELGSQLGGKAHADGDKFSRWTCTWCMRSALAQLNTLRQLRSLIEHGSVNKHVHSLPSWRAIRLRQVSAIACAPCLACVAMKMGAIALKVFIQCIFFREAAGNFAQSKALNVSGNRFIFAFTK